MILNPNPLKKGYSRAAPQVPFLNKEGQEWFNIP